MFKPSTVFSIISILFQVNTFGLLNVAKAWLFTKAKSEPFSLFSRFDNLWKQWNWIVHTCLRTREAIWVMVSKLDKVCCGFLKVAEPLTWPTIVQDKTTFGGLYLNFVTVSEGGNSSSELLKNSCSDIWDYTTSSQFRFSPSRLFITCRATQEATFPAMWGGRGLTFLLNFHSMF